LRFEIEKTSTTLLRRELAGSKRSRRETEEEGRKQTKVRHIDERAFLYHWVLGAFSAQSSYSIGDPLALN
jgi:hypothetical protein